MHNLRAEKRDRDVAWHDLRRSNEELESIRTVARQLGDVEVASIVGRELDKVYSKLEGVEEEAGRHEKNWQCDDIKLFGKEIGLDMRAWGPTTAAQETGDEKHEGVGMVSLENADEETIIGRPAGAVGEALWGGQLDMVEGEVGIEHMGCRPPPHPSSGADFSGVEDACIESSPWMELEDLISGGASLFPMDSCSTKLR